MVATVPAARLAASANATASSSGAMARAIARCYLRYVSAVWRGDQSAAAFANWIDRYWGTELPPPPAAIPDAISPHGGAGHGISWFETPAEVIGYVNGLGGGYRLPKRAIDRAAEIAPAGPCGGLE